MLPESAIMESARRTLLFTRSNEASSLRPEPRNEVATLGGIPAIDLICWDFVTGRKACSCQGDRAHVFELCCGGALNAALGGTHVCKRPNVCKFTHPNTEEVRRQLSEWWRQARGSEPVWSTISTGDKKANSALFGGERSTLSAEAGGGHDDGGHEDGMGERGGRHCTVPIEVQMQRLQKYEGASSYVKRFVAEPFFDTLLADQSLRMLLSMRK